VSRAVLDASVFVAACSPSEVRHDAARTMIDAHPENRPFLVPAIFRVEVMSALARRGEGDVLLDTVDALITGPRFHVCALDEALLMRSVEVARTARVRAYDAVYAALALSRDAVLLTLDEDLRRRLSEVHPEALVRSLTSAAR